MVSVFVIRFDRVEILGNLWERPGTDFNSQIKPSMPTPRITIHFENKPIRIFGLPDKPVFSFQDIASIVGKKYSIPNYELIPELEAFSLAKESLSVVNRAGVYKMIFNAGDEIQALDFEKFFIREVEPALTKYAYPKENSSC